MAMCGRGQFEASISITAAATRRGGNLAGCSVSTCGVWRRWAYGGGGGGGERRALVKYISGGPGGDGGRRAAGGQACGMCVYVYVCVCVRVRVCVCVCVCVCKCVDVVVLAPRMRAVDARAALGRVHRSKLGYWIGDD